MTYCITLYHSILYRTLPLETTPTPYYRKSSGEAAADLAQLLELAAHPRLHVKLSALYALSAGTGDSRYVNH